MKQKPSNRDPRVDPRPGDVISREIPTAKQGVIIRDVHRAHGLFVHFSQDNGFTSRPRWTNIYDWKRWAKKAEVLEVSE